MRIILFKARTTSHEWAYLFASSGDGLYRRSPDGEPLEIIPGTECRNTGCCDMNGAPIFEHDYMKCWHTINHLKVRYGNTYSSDVYLDIGEIIYVDNVLVKRIEGVPDAPLPYQYLHNPYEPLMLCFNEVIGNSVAHRRVTFRKSDIQISRERKKK